MHACCLVLHASYKVDQKAANAHVRICSIAHALHCLKNATCSETLKASIHYVLSELFAGKGEDVFSKAGRGKRHCGVQRPPGFRNFFSEAGFENIFRRQRTWLSGQRRAGDFLPRVAVLLESLGE